MRRPLEVAKKTGWSIANLSGDIIGVQARPTKCSRWVRLHRAHYQIFFALMFLGDYAVMSITLSYKLPREITDNYTSSCFAL